MESTPVVLEAPDGLALGRERAACSLLWCSHLLLDPIANGSGKDFANDRGIGGDLLSRHEVRDLESRTVDRRETRGALAFDRIPRMDANPQVELGIGSTRLGWPLTKELVVDGLRVRGVRIEIGAQVSLEKT